MNKIRCGAVGVGYLGKFHADKYAILANAELTAVCDIDSAVVEQIGTKLHVPAFTDYHDLIAKVDAVSIATPTSSHFEISKFFLENNIHVLVEKPITETVEEANILIDIAKKNNLIFQVGHLERFNSARIALDEYLHAPKFIDSNRLAPFNLRSIDVNVILDLMIHDIDIIQNMVGSPIKEINADGTPVLSRKIDIANARIKFENGCVANVTASRISYKSERKMRIFQPNGYISLDYQNKKFMLFHKNGEEKIPGIPDIVQEEHVFTESDSLKLQIEAFINTIMGKASPSVTGEDGRDALATAIRITEMIHANLAQLAVA